MGSMMFYVYLDGYVLNMPRMFYCSVHMPIGWEGLSMPTDGCSLCVPIITVNSKLRCAKRDSVDPYVDRFLKGSG